MINLLDVLASDTNTRHQLIILSPESGAMTKSGKIGMVSGPWKVESRFTTKARRHEEDFETLCVFVLLW